MAENGLEAYEFIISNKEKPDLLLTVIHMPVMDGYELTSKVKEFDPSIFILILTASSEREAIQSAFSSGATDFIRKPVDSLELVARIQNLIKLKNALNELEGKTLN